MEDVRIYDFEFNLLHIEHDITSCNWSLYENDIGSFELHFPLESRLTQVAAEHTYLVAVQGTKQAVITGRQLNTEGVLYGRSCNWLLTRFCISGDVDTDLLYDAGELGSKDAPAVCAYLIGLGMGGVENFIADTGGAAGFGEVYIKSEGVTPVFDLIQKALAQSAAGHTVVFDVANRQWVFRVTKGQALSVVLSDDNRNAYETEYTEDMQDAFTGGYYEQEMQNMGDWDASANSPQLTNGLADNYAKGYRVSADGTCFGLTFTVGDCIVCDSEDGLWKKAEAIEGFTEHIPSTMTGIYAWETFLDGASRQEAAQNLAEQVKACRTTLKTRGFLYGAHYQPGDSVLLQVKKGDFASGTRRRITGVRLWYEGNDVGEQPIFEEEAE